MTSKKHFTTEEAKQIGEALGIDWSKFDVEQYRMGLDVELEHGAADPHTNVTDDDPMTTGRIALAHLNEFPDYYTRLERMEREAEEKREYMEYQYRRLGYFLIASAFLVAGLVQLIATDTNNTLLEDKVILLVHAIALLGGAIAALYFFMNGHVTKNKWWDEHSTEVEVFHTFIIPLFFVVFWIGVWGLVTPYPWWIGFIAFLIFISACEIARRLRKKIEASFQQR